MKVLKTLIAALLPFNVALAAPAQDELARFVKDVRALSARFEQVQRDEKGKVLQTGSGTMSIARPGRFRWEQTQPYKQLIVCDAKTVWIFDPDLAQVTKRPAAQVLDGTPAALLSQRAGLTDAFRVEDGGKDGAARIVRLVPRDADSDFRSIDLWLAAGVPGRMRFHDQLGGQTDVEFTQVKVNAALDESNFRFTPPAGVEVVEAEEAPKP